MTSASAADVLRFAAAESPRRNNNKSNDRSSLSRSSLSLSSPLLINEGDRLL
jgi:hypothetical protein